MFIFIKVGESNYEICNLCNNILFEIYYFKGVLVWIIFVLIYIIIDYLKY